MSIKSAVQKLEPGALIELFELDARAAGGDVVLFHGHTQVEQIHFQGKSYNAWPVRAEGFVKSGDRPVNPKLSVGNINGSISALCIYFDDLVGAKITRRRTLGQFLDAENFPEGNSSADPTQEFPPDVWFIERKTAESSDFVEFELASAMSLEGIMLPRRQIIANNCPWTYRDSECGYTGGPVADALDQPTADPAKDACSKSLKACKMRFGENNELPYGGFPAASLMRT